MRLYKEIRGNVTGSRKWTMAEKTGKEKKYFRAFQNSLYPDFIN